MSLYDYMEDGPFNVLRAGVSGAIIVCFFGSCMSICRFMGWSLFNRYTFTIIMRILAFARDLLDCSYSCCFS